MKRFRRVFALLSVLMLSVLTTACADRMVVLDPRGPIGEQQRDLILLSTALCLIVIVPVLILTAVIVWRYRDRPGRRAAYNPDWEHSAKLEVVWWGIPILIIAILAVVTVQSTYALEPSKPLPSEKEPLTIQVASLDWKWLFMYPEQGIATVNYVQFPEDTPIRFELTADAPMNSFWIPQLGGQIYTMSGMAMVLHLQADEPGEYFGSGANFSGREFASMRFVAKATSREAFDAWVRDIKGSAPALTLEGYKELAAPGVSGTKTYSAFPEGLFEQIVTKYAASHNHSLSQKGEKGGHGTGDASGTGNQTGHHRESNHHEHPGH